MREELIEYLLLAIAVTILIGFVLSIGEGAFQSPSPNAP